MPDNPSKRARQLNRLIELNHLSARLDPSALLQSIVEMAADLTQSDYASILIYNPATESLKFVAGPWLQLPMLAKIDVPIDGSIAGDTYRDNEVIMLSKADQDDRLFRQVQELLGIRTHSLLSVPVRHREIVLGVMQAVNKFEDEYNHEDTAFLLSLAAHAGTAVYLQQLEARLDQAELAMEELEKHKTEFISITSHELRTPLGVILGNATFLRQMIPGPDLLPQLDAIVISALKLKELVESLSKADNLQSGTVRLRAESVDINALVEDLATTYQAEARRKEITLEMSLSPDLNYVVGEADKIAGIIQNLLRNALTFTDKGGHVQISTQRLPGYVQVAVSDTGLGISDEEQELIFNRFYQVESHLTRRHGGMGLGLSVAKAMVELHGGQIWVKSQVGRGSTFAFVLPADQHGDPPPDDAQSQDG